MEMEAFEHLLLRFASALAARKAGMLRITGDEPEFIPLSDFIRGEREIISVEEPLGYDRETSQFKAENRMLAPRIQVLMWLMLDAVHYVFHEDRCLESQSLDASNILVSRRTLQPVFRELSLTAKSPERVQSNMTSLATIFETTILGSSSVPPPFEVTHLIQLMKGDAAAMLFLIWVHPCLVPLPNRTIYFSRMNWHAWVVTRWSDKEGFEYLLHNLSFHENWDSWVAENSYLKRSYDDADEPYDPQGARTGTPPAQEVLRYIGNVPGCGILCDADAHSACQTDAAGRTLPGSFHRTDSARMIYSVMDTLLASMAESFQRLGQLCHMKLEFLFPGREIEEEADDSWIPAV